MLLDSDYRFVRRTMVSLVLGTDMALHSDITKARRPCRVAAFAARPRLCRRRVRDRPGRAAAAAPPGRRPGAPGGSAGAVIPGPARGAPQDFAASADLPYTLPTLPYTAPPQDFAASARLFGADLAAWPPERRAALLQMLVHCADIGNPARPLRLSLAWTGRIVEEQLAEGDRERALGLPSSAIRDRSRVDVPSSQARRCGVGAATGGGWGGWSGAARPGLYADPEQGRPQTLMLASRTVWLLACQMQRAQAGLMLAGGRRCARAAHARTPPG